MTKNIAKDTSLDKNGQASTALIVVGSGVAGICAAIEAANQGLDVTLLDRFTGGGASALSGGVVYAGGTRIQKLAGEQDSVENMFNYLKQEVKGVVSDETLQQFCQQSSGDLDWLIAQGVEFDATSYAEKTSYPPEGYFLYFSGNELCHPYNKHAMPVRRGHRTKGKSFTGKVLYQVLREKAEQLSNIQFIDFANVNGLLTNEQDEVVGVEYQAITDKFSLRKARLLAKLANNTILLKPSIGVVLRKKIAQMQQQENTVELKASAGVLLTTGGFIFNRKMVKEHAPLHQNCQALGENCDGSGINMAKDVGAATAHMDRISAWRFISPPGAMVKGLLVDKQAQRIINEDLYGAKTAEHMVQKNLGKGLLIVDSKLLKEIKFQARPGKIAWHQWMPNRIMLGFCSKKASSIEALAAKCKLPAVILAQTIEQYNYGVEKRDDKFGKADSYLQKIKQGPFYAIDISISNPIVPAPVLTLGGLQVDEINGQVLNQQGEGITGLYAAGRAAVGICSNSYVSGLSLADCIFSGRRASQFIAKQDI